MEVYVMMDGRRAGPFRVFELKEMLEGGEVSRDDLVWFRDQESWRPLREVDALGWLLADTGLATADGDEEPDAEEGVRGEEAPSGRVSREEMPSSGPREVATRSTPAPVAVVAGTEPQAWSRFWARLFDWQLMLVLVFAAGVSTGSLEDPVTLASSIWFWVFIVLAWAVLEAVVLSSWGTTPGKRLLGIRVVRDEDGRRPTVAEALKRSLSMAFFGWGFGLFIVRELSWVVSYFSFRRLGTTVWDRQQRLHIEYERLSPSRLVLFIVVFLLVVMVLGMIAAPFVETLLRELDSAPPAGEPPGGGVPPVAPPPAMPPTVT